MNDRACFKCGSQDHFIQDCLEMAEKDKFQSARSSITTTRGRPPRNMGTNNRGVTKDLTVRSEVRASARTYAIRTHEDASSSDVITGIMSSSRGKKTDVPASKKRKGAASSLSPTMEIRHPFLQVPLGPK
ncbi:serine/arginine-rich splicing factor 7-like [Gossypium hirsutum]|uniref:Serine/arginine-rich splicing factor 7-like n=1 Tax=Gossypium hirsutum TaxID=3635 RepID=A0ABM3BWA5_GOSHI|nr:serine/arginine-rich splicing factor 7-like [Gossypium hirsutum]